MSGGRLLGWLESRSGAGALLARALDEPIPGGARLRYVFGSVLVYLFLQQVVLGVLLATYYSPSASDAWASVAYIQDRVSAGWFLRGLHHHGSSAMIVVALLHAGQVVLAGAYRAPRELNWWSGLAMAAMIGGFALTGYLLPWDQKGYWATQVATGILGGVPFGELPQRLVQGGSDYGNLTITRFYSLHVFVLPALLGGSLLAHVALFRRHGVTPPAALGEAELAATTQPFWPDQLFRDVCAMAATAVALVWATYATHGAELFAPADPSSTFMARPEWYFLFLFELLKYFEGPLAVIATFVIPGAVTIFLVALPWVDRGRSRRVRDRLPVLIAMGLLMAGVVSLTALALVGDRRDEAFAEGVALAHAEADRARELAAEGVAPEGGTAVWTNDPQYQAIASFREHCATCHDLDGRGGDEAPSLRHYNDRAWLRGVIRDPRSSSYFGGTKAHEDMEAVGEADLSPAELDETVEFLISLRGDEVAFDRALAERGAARWDESECSNCHELEAGAAGGGAPTLGGRGTLEWIARVIQDSSRPDLFDEGAEMPKFGEKLGAEELEALARLVYAQGGFGPAPASFVLPEMAPEPPAGARARGEETDGGGETGSGEGTGDPAGNDSPATEGG